MVLTPVGSQVGAASSASQVAQRLGLTSPEEAFKILSLVSVEGKPIIDPDLASDKEKAEALMTVFAKNGVDAKELLALAAKIKSGLKHGSLTWGADHRIQIDKKQFGKMLRDIREANLPPEQRHSIRELRGLQAPRPAATIARRTIQEPKTPADMGAHLPRVQLVGNVFETIATLLRSAAGLAIEAAREVSNTARQGVAA